LRQGVIVEMRRAEELTLQIVSPAVDGTDDVCRVAATLKHDRLPVAADVGDELDPVGVTNQRLRVVTAGERTIVAGVRDHQLVSGVTGAACEEPLLGLEGGRIAIPGNGELRRRASQMPYCGETRHAPYPFFAYSVELTNPTQQPGTNTAFSAAPDRFAKSAARKVR
jgi:hypothetical protein